MADFKESGFMYAIAAAIIGFVLVQSIFFFVRAWRHGKKIGMSTKVLKNTVTSSALFTIAPAIAILTTVVVLSSSLGIVLPWIRLTVVGNLQYEATAAQSAMDAFKGTADAVPFGQDITNPTVFTAVTWVMTLGVIIYLVLVPLFLKTVQNKIGKVTSNKDGENKFGDIISAATFIGLIAAFIGNALAGKAATIVKDGVEEKTGMGAGVMSVAVLITSTVLVIVLQKLCQKYKWEKFEPFVMPLSMFAGLGMAVLLYTVLPESISMLEWRP